MTMYQQMFASKRLARAYFGDYLTERYFTRWNLPRALPTILAQQSTSVTDQAVAEKLKPRKLKQLNTINKPRAVVGALEDGVRLKANEAQVAQALKIPTGSMIFSEIERRLDTLVFRALMAPSIYAARSLIVRGHVTLNGDVYTDPNVKLDPGDVFALESAKMPFWKGAYEVGKSKHVIFNATAEAQEHPQASDIQETTEEAETDAESAAETSVSVEPTDKPKTEADFFIPEYVAPWLWIPAYLEVDYRTCSACYVRHPTARPNYSEIPSPYDANGEVVTLATEWYRKFIGREPPEKCLVRGGEKYRIGLGTGNDRGILSMGEKLY